MPFRDLEARRKYQREYQREYAKLHPRKRDWSKVKRRRWRKRERPYAGDGSASYFGTLAEYDELVERGVCIYAWATTTPCDELAVEGSRWCRYHQHHED